MFLHEAISSNEGEAMLTKEPTIATNARAPAYAQGHDKYWAAVLAWFICAMLYFYQYAVRSAPGVMRGVMSATWGNDPVATMNAYYYMVYAFSALAAGALLDRYGARKTLPIAAASVGAFSLLLASGNEHLAIVGFTLQAIGAVFGFVGSVYVAAKLLPPRSLPTFVGLAQMLGMAGAAVGSKPVAEAIGRNPGLGWSWQSVWVVFAVSGVILAIALWRILPARATSPVRFSFKGLVRPYEIVFENPQSYLCGLIGGLLFAPTTIGVMVWATSFLHQGENVSISNAASLVSTVPIGWIIGCPLMGFISDRIGRRKPVLIVGAVAMGFLTVFAIYVQPPMAVRYFAALGLGIASGAAMIPFSMIKEANPPEVKGSAAGAMNFLCFGVTGVLSPFIARMLDAGPDRTETLPGFQHGLATLAFGVAVALMLTFFLRETGQAVAQQKPHDQVLPGRPGAGPMSRWNVA
jgi:MFS family permease